MTNLLKLRPESATEYLDDFVELLCDATDSGASVGYLAPLDPGEARKYWQGVIAALSEGYRILLGALEKDRLVGSVQLDLATKPNAGHRAEVIKLLVHRRARRKGIGRALMEAAEAAAKEAGRTLLVLDTRRGDLAESLYLGLGYQRAGIVPRYAISSSGGLDDTVFMYKEIRS